MPQKLGALSSYLTPRCMAMFPAMTLALFCKNTKAELTSWSSVHDSSCEIKDSSLTDSFVPRLHAEILNPRKCHQLEDFA